MQTTKLMLLGLNEVNFDFVKHYIARGELPEFSRLFDSHGYCLTRANTAYHELEPWIQWVSIHTGKKYRDHNVFHLGDIEDHNTLQIWETLEEKGFSVAAISPMNASNRTLNSKFFISDPWTNTESTGPSGVVRLARALSAIVNNNASARAPLTSLATFGQGVVRFAQATNYLTYFRYLLQSARNRWSRALLLDLFLSDCLIRLTRKHQPDFVTCFLNASAHLQHHYLFSSSAYSGGLENPNWYVGKSDDPVLESYRLYDAILKNIRLSVPNYRLLVATGLTQEACENVVYYWRLKNHADWLTKVGLEFDHVEPRMSRDFKVFFDSQQSAARGARLLRDAKSCRDGIALFDVEELENSVFASLTYPNDINSCFSYMIEGNTIVGLEQDVAFVAIKNGRHTDKGFFLDAGASKKCNSNEIDVETIHKTIVDAFEPA